MVRTSKLNRLFLTREACIAPRIDLDSFFRGKLLQARAETSTAGTRSSGRTDCAGTAFSPGLISPGCRTAPGARWHRSSPGCSCP
jgi:hypothetical protein